MFGTELQAHYVIMFQNKHAVVYTVLYQLQASIQVLPGWVHFWLPSSIAGKQWLGGHWTSRILCMHVSCTTGTYQVVTDVYELCVESCLTKAWFSSPTFSQDFCSFSRYQRPLSHNSTHPIHSFGDVPIKVFYICLVMLNFRSHFYSLQLSTWISNHHLHVQALHTHWHITNQKLSGTCRLKSRTE